MSSKIEVQRVCQYCGKEFTAKTTVTKYCSKKCNTAHYKELKRAEKIKQSNIETTNIKNQPIEQIQAKEFLTVREVALLINCSLRSAYYYIENGTISAVNIGQRMTRVKRSEIDKLFQNNTEPLSNEVKLIQHNIEDCYTISEIQEKFNISSGALYNIIKRNNLPKINKGKYVFVPKKMINELLT